MTFDAVSAPDQEFHLHRDPQGLDEYPVKYVDIYILYLYDMYIGFIKFSLL